MAGRVLVIASWSGPRRGDEVGAELLDTWCEVFSKYKHSLDAVVIVVNEYENETQAYRDQLSRFEALSTSRIFRRPNLSGSYGAWWDAWKRYGTEFDWYFIFEDDMFPCQDNWDDLILEFAEPGVGYVGQLAKDLWQFPLHMAGACGAISSEALSKCEYLEYGAYIYDPMTQVGFSNMVVRAGFKLADIAGKYLVPWSYKDVDNIMRIMDYGNLDGEPLIVPFRYHKNLPVLKVPLGREVAEDRHKSRMREDSEYRQTWEPFDAKV